MWLFSLFSNYNVIFSIVTLTQIINGLGFKDIVRGNHVIVKSIPYTINDDFNVTTIYKFQDSLIKNKYGDGFKDSNFKSTYFGMYLVENHTPSIKDGIFQNDNYMTFYYNAFWKPQLVTLPGTLCKSDQEFCFSKVMDYDFFNSIIHGSFDYYSDTAEEYKSILSIIWVPQSSLNYLEIVYMYNGFYSPIQLQIYDENEGEVFKLNLKVNITTKLTLQSQDLLENTKYTIKFYASLGYYSYTESFQDKIKFWIFQITNNFPSSYVDSTQKLSNLHELISSTTRYNFYDEMMLYPNYATTEYNYYDPTQDSTSTTDYSKDSTQKFSNLHELITTRYNYYDEMMLYPNYATTEYNYYDPTQDSTSTTDYSKVNGQTSNLQTNYLLKECLNGGYKINYEYPCICPPGFKGIFCEEGCGPNSYGTDCSGLCSILTKGCRGMYFCTNRYGCTCPVGLTGPFCDEDCAPYSYGADCNQYCSRNCFNNTCDQYTGICSQGCLQGYLPPNCIEKYTAYLLNSPKLISAAPDSIIIEINFELENIKDINEHVNVTYYQLLWKASNEDQFTYSGEKLFNYNSNTADTLSDLKSDTTYTIGVLLIMEDGNYDNQSIVFGQYKTTCYNPSLSLSNIKVREEIKSINITWDKISFSGLECKITKFVISLHMNKYEKNNSTYISNEIPFSKYSYDIHDVIPGNEYTIKVTPMTINGDLPSLTYFIKPKITNEDLKIKDITAKTTKQNSNINLSWKCVNKIDPNDNIVNVPVTYIVKYKINRIFSCSLKIIKYHWTFIKVDNITNYEILDAIPNTQYMIQVTIDSKNDNAVARKNTIYVLTPTLLPTLQPVLSIEHPVYITNNSITIYWEMNHTQCSKINGFFLNYVIEFRESNENITIIKETKQNYICLEELKPSTRYEIKVFIKNHVGYNSKYFLLYNFKTKYDLAPVDDLVIYKKSSKNRMLGLRWRYFDTEHLDKFVISLYDDISKNLKNETIIPPVACLAWPDFYCYTFHDIHFNNKHSIKVKAKSLEYPEGGKTSSVSCNSVDGIPDSPSNVKAIEIGKTNLTIQWDIPWMFNGELKSFILNIEETSSMDIQTCCESIMPVEIPFRDEQPIYTYTFNDLRPGSTYSIGVLSKSSWYGSPSRIEVTTLI